MGSDRVVLGSDYPFPLGEHKPGLLVEETAELSEEDRARILWHNGFEFLGLDSNQYS
jgi:aminocarboxymuconate-semialdehyde decarboxylase